MSRKKKGRHPTEPQKSDSKQEIVYLSQEDEVANVIMNTVASLWNAVHELSRLRRTTKKHYLVTIFGSARIEAGSPLYDEVKELAAELTRMGCGIISGGGPGMMQAANEGAASVLGPDPDRSIGLKIDLDFEPTANSFVGRVYEHKTFFSRLHQFVVMSDAYIVVDGGIGTLLELSMIWQLLQVRKLYDTPLLLLGDMWKALLEWARTWMIRDDIKLAGERDMLIPHTPSSARETIEIIRQHRQQWLLKQAALEASRCG